MSSYLRPGLHGVTIFFTLRLTEAGSRHLTDHVALLRGAVRSTMAERPFVIDAWVTLPDHLHCIWRLPPGDDEAAPRWSAIKSRFARAVAAAGGPEGGLWQSRYWEHPVRGPAEHRHLIRYCWMNPVKHGLVTQPGDWTYSSYHRDRLEGIARDCALLPRAAPRARASAAPVPG